MVKSNVPARNGQRESDTSSLAALSRTLETLETRLAKLGSAGRHALPSEASESRRDPAIFAASSPPLREAALPLRSQTRKSLSDAVSEIAMRRQMLEAEPRTEDAARLSGRSLPAPPAPPSAQRQNAASPARRPEPDDSVDRRFRSLADDVEALKAEGSNYALMADVAEELQRLRHELQAGGPSRDDPRFDAMRDAFDALRRMIETRESADVIGAELAHVSGTLARLTEEGADRATLNTLRAELEEMRSQFGEMARETTVNAVGRRWDEFETRHAEDARREAEAKQDLKQELERLRESLRSLASEDQVRAVERRWDEFETRYLGAGQADARRQAETPAEPAIPQLLRDQLEGLREKLDGIADAAPLAAAEKRWVSLEERLDSRDVEISIQRLSERMGEIETMLGRLPESLGLAPLEARLQSLAASVDALAERSGDADLDHFLGLEERLDEISRAIVATSLQAPPVLDMAPIERIEARIATLTSRVDRFTSDNETEILSGRIAGLSDRVEELANNPVAEELAARMASLTERLESAFAEMEQPRIDVKAVEARLSALALRLEDAVQPQVDPSLLRSLEGQIARLSEHLANPVAARVADLDPEFDRRLAAVEQRLDDNREQLIVAAREAAEETARRMQAAGDRRQGEHVAQLSENLRALEALSRETDGRSNQVFDAVHSTLLKIVDRLEQIERDVNRSALPDARGALDEGRIDRAAAHLAAAAASVGGLEAPRGNAAAGRTLRDAFARRSPAKAADGTASAAVADSRLLDRHEPSFAGDERAAIEAPSLDASDMIDRSEANRPLEPGSGAPDIGALLERVRLKQRNLASGAEGEAMGAAATVAAANRAARAAAAEADQLRSPPGAGTSLQKRLSLRELVSRRRKTVLACVAAVLAVLAVLPIKAAYFPGSAAPAAQKTALQGSAVPASGSATSTEANTLPPLGTSSAGKPWSQGLAASGATTEASAPGRPAAPDRTSPAPAPAKTTETAAVTPGAALGDAMTPSASADPEGDAGRPAASAGAKASLPDTADAATVLAAAVAELPASVSSGIPALPAGIGPDALVKAATAGDPKALFEVGLRLMEGHGGEPKPAEAVNWFAEAGRRGFAPAQYSLGTLFEKGNGVARDAAVARDWYLAAALQGNVRAMHNLAVLYATGIDGKSEPDTAARWFESAADRGMRDSQYNLGILYAQGSGVELDMAQSYKWFAIVAKAGDKDAAAKRDEIAKRLTPAQLKSAEASVAGWTQQARPEAANTVEIPKDWSQPKSDQTASIDMTRVVRNIQGILGKLGYDVGTPDGVAGGKTRTAIIAFQKQAGLTADGAINEPLIRALLQRRNG